MRDLAAQEAAAAVSGEAECSAIGVLARVLHTCRQPYTTTLQGSIGHDGVKHHDGTPYHDTEQYHHLHHREYERTDDVSYDARHDDTYAYDCASINAFGHSVHRGARPDGRRR